MPFYNYQCSTCETIWETMATMTEDKEDPPTHCPKCDPEEMEKGTLYKYFGNIRPAFNLKGSGWFKPGWN